MKIDEVMEMVFNEAAKNNTLLKDDEKKVLAALMYSYHVCKESKNNTIIRAIPNLRKDVGISLNRVYDALRNLEMLGYLERTPGKKRTLGERATATAFKLNFEEILNPKKKERKIDFSKEIEFSKTSINYIDADIDADAKTDVDINIDTDKELVIESESDKELVINKESNRNIKSNRIIKPVKLTSSKNSPSKGKENTGWLTNSSSIESIIQSGEGFLKEEVISTEESQEEIDYKAQLGRLLAMSARKAEEENKHILSQFN